MQVTLKTHVIPNINETKLKQALLGKNTSDAQRILGGLRNIKTYQLNISPAVPFIQSVPDDLKRVVIEIVME